MIGIYHNRDLDGSTCGAIMKLKYPDIELYGYDYGEPFNYDIVKGKKVYMADISLPMKEMYKLAKESNWQLTWIDHHISAIKEHEKYIDTNKDFCQPILDSSLSACELTWMHFFPDKRVPLAVRLLGEYDTWRNKDKNRWNNEVLPFQFGMRVGCSSPETFPVSLFDNFHELNMIIEIIKEGKLILKYQAQQNEIQCKRASFEIEFEGLRAICLNGGGFNSDVFKSVYNESRHDIMMPFQYNGRYWTVSLYTTKDNIDCSKIAKQWGGGGHKKAAGFQVNNVSKVLCK